MKLVGVIVCATGLSGFIAGMLVGTWLADGSTAADIASAEDSRPRVSEVIPGSLGGSMKIAGPEETGDAPEGSESVSHYWKVLHYADEITRHAEWLRLLRDMDGTHGGEIRDLFRKLKARGKQVDFEWSMLWSRWGQVDGAGAMENAMTEPQGDTRSALARMVMQGWSSVDADRARAWLASKRDTPEYSASLLGYLDGLSRSDLDRAGLDAVALAKGFELGDFTKVLVDRAVQDRDTSGMVDWWSALPDTGPGGLRQASAGRVLYWLEQLDMDGAKRLATDFAQSLSRDDMQIGEFAERLSGRSPKEAVEWVASLPPSAADGHYTAIGRTISEWMRQDKAAAEQWIASLPPSALKDQAIAAKNEAATPSTIQIRRAMLDATDSLLVEQLRANKSTGALQLLIQPTQDPKR